MTCIVGFVENEDIYIGADSIAVDDVSYRVMRTPKVFIRDDMIFGYASSFRMGQILKNSFDIPKKPYNMDDEKYLQSLFIDSLIKCYEEKNYSTIDNNASTGGNFLLGYHKKLYQIQDDFAILDSNTYYDSIGVGAGYAIGALCAIEKLRADMNVENKIKIALEIASQFSLSCKPFHILKLEISPEKTEEIVV